MNMIFKKFLISFFLISDLCLIAFLSFYYDNHSGYSNFLSLVCFEPSVINSKHFNEFNLSNGREENENILSIKSEDNENSVSLDSLDNESILLDSSCSLSSQNYIVSINNYMSDQVINLTYNEKKNNIIYVGKSSNNLTINIENDQLFFFHLHLLSDVTSQFNYINYAPESISHSICIIDGITYVDGIMIVNKSYGLPSTYDPGDIYPEVKSAFAAMKKAAAAEGLNIYISSGYRSYARQKVLYQKYINRDGQVKADTFSARPGYSEHQTGLCIDLNSISDSFNRTPEAAWVAEHAHEYGFIVRFPEGKEDITGYKYEGWHLRYLGVEDATKVYESGLCLEEYLGVESTYID